MRDLSQSESQNESQKKVETGTNSDNTSFTRSFQSSFHNTIENSNYLKKLKETLELKNNLKEIKDTFEPLRNFVEENKVINELYQNEGNVTTKINEEDKRFKFDNFIFEERSVKILSDYYDLKEYVLYPYFSVVLSEKKRTNVTNINYYKITFEISDKNPVIEIKPKNKKSLLIRIKKSMKLLYLTRKINLIKKMIKDK